MTFDPDIAADYLLLDGLEPFTLKQGNLDPVSVNNCLREALSQEDAQILSQSGLGVQPGNLVLNIWAAELPAGVSPAAGDSLTDGAGVGYVVQGRGDYWPLTGRYRLILRAKVLA
jgi:hypothetical protein